MTLCHNLKSQKSNFYYWISITWQNSIWCKPIKIQYFDWVAYWCTKGRNFAKFSALWCSYTTDQAIRVLPRERFGRVTHHYDSSVLWVILVSTTINITTLLYSQMSLNVLEDVSEWHLSLHSKHRETVFEWILIRPWFWPIRESDFRINSKLIRWTIRKIKILFQLTRETCCNLIWWFATILATISSYGQSVLCDRPCPESPEM